MPRQCEAVLVSEITFDRLLVPLDDIEGLAHGIVSVDPPKVQCDGCGLVATGDRMTSTILFCGIKFNSRVYDHGDPRRLCADCADAAGWDRR